VFYEYAIDPAVFTSFERFTRLLDAMEPGEGRLLNEYPSAWRTLVFEQLPKNAGTTRKRAELRLKDLGTRILRRRGATFDATQGWISNAMAENTRIPFKAVVVECGQDKTNLVSYEDLDAAHPLWAKFADFMPRDVDAIVKATEPIFRDARQIVLIDPYFYSLPDQRNLLEKLLAVASVDADVEIFCQERKDRRLLSPGFHRWPIRLREKQRLHVFVLRPSATNKRLHNRYLYTEFGGLQFGDAIRVGDGVDSLSLLSMQKVQVLREDYCKATTAFRVVEKFTLPPIK